MTPAGWLAWLHAHAIAANLDAHLVLSQKTADGRWPTQSVHIERISDADAILAGKPDWYARGQLTDRNISGKRGGSSEAGWVTHFAADFDTSDGKHSNSETRPTRQQALQRIEAMVPAPSAVLDSGGGYYVIWRLTEPYRVDDDASRTHVQNIARRLELRLADGHVIDNVTDLARVIRPAGTINGKYGAPVVVVGRTESRDTTLEYLDATLPPLPPAPVVERVPASSATGDSYGALFANRHTLAEVLAADPVDQWTYTGTAGQFELWHREGSANTTSLKHDTATGCVFAMSATVQTRLGVELSDGLTIYRLACLMAGADEHHPVNGTGRLGAMLEAVATERHEQRQQQANDWISDIERQQAEAGTGDDMPPTMLELLYAGEVTADNLDAIPPLSWFVEGWIRAHALNVVYGPAKAGKSFWTLNLALEAARGGTWAGQNFDRPQSVVYFTAEDPDSHAERIRGWEQKHGTTAPGGLILQTQQIALNSPAWVASVCDYVKQREPDLVVIDTLAAATPGLKENDTDAMSRITHDLERLVRILPPKGTLILNHHAGKTEGNGPRGSSALDGAHRSLILVKYDKATNTIKVTQEKVRDGHAAEPLNYRIQSQTLPPDSTGKCREIGVMVEIPYSTAISETASDIYDSLAEAFGFDGTFSKADIGSVSGLTGGSLQRLITAGLERSPQMWERLGKGAAVRYRLIRRPGTTGELSLT